MKVYTMGYCGWKHEAIEETLLRLDAVLVDVRMVPRSRAPMWNGSTLAKRFGDRYLPLQAFGNRNYKGTVEQIEIVDFAGGVTRLQETVIAAGRSVILLCGCKDVTQCHRKVLAEGLAITWGATVEHLAVPEAAPAAPAKPTAKTAWHTPATPDVKHGQGRLF